MIEGVIHHCTEMEVNRQYLDSHGQSMIARSPLLSADCSASCFVATAESHSLAKTVSPGNRQGRRICEHEPIRKLWLLNPSRVGAQTEFREVKIGKAPSLKEDEEVHVFC
jgi:hypothetical protein